MCSLFHQVKESFIWVGSLQNNFVFNIVKLFFFLGSKFDHETVKKMSNTLYSKWKSFKVNLPLMTFHRVASSKKSYIVKETWSFQYLWPFSRHQAPKRLRKLFCSNGHGEGNSLLFFWYKICWILFFTKLSRWWFLLEMNLYKTSRLLVSFISTV